MLAALQNRSRADSLGAGGVNLDHEAPGFLRRFCRPTLRRVAWSNHILEAREYLLDRDGQGSRGQTHLFPVFAPAPRNLYTYADEIGRPSGRWAITADTIRPRTSPQYVHGGSLKAMRQAAL